MIRLLMFTALTFSAVPSLVAQSLPLRPDDTIRIVGSDSTISGDYRLIALRSDTLVIGDGGARRTSVTTSDLRELSVYRRRSRAGSGAAIGFGVGAGLGIAIGIAAGGPSGSMFPRDEMAPSLGLIFGAAGLTLGALFGLATTEYTWEPMVLNPGIAGRAPEGWGRTAPTAEISTGSNSRN